MITKFEKFNEGINHLLVGPTDKEIWSHYMEGNLKGLLKSIPTSPEDFFNQMREDCIQDGNYFSKNGVKLFHQDLKNGYLFISNEYVWSFFEKVYRFNYRDIQSVISFLLIGDTEWGGLTPHSILKNQFN